MFIPKVGEAVIVRWDQGYGSVEVVEEYPSITSPSTTDSQEATWPSVS